MRYRLQVFVPVNDNHGRPVPLARAEAERALTELSGGATSYQAHGAWIGSQLFREPVLVVEADAEGDGAQLWTRLVEVARAVKEKACQEAVYVRIRPHVTGERATVIY